MAQENDNQVVETVHLLVSLLQQPNGLARRLVQKAGGDPSEMVGFCMDYIRKLPKVTGEYEQVGCTSALRTAAEASGRYCLRFLGSPFSLSV